MFIQPYAQSYLYVKTNAQINKSLMRHTRHRGDGDPVYAAV